MINLKPPFRVAKYDDFKALDIDRLANSSYKQIAFPLGCSRSEFKMTLDDRELCLLAKDASVIGFARIKSIMFTHIYLDIFCIGGEPINSGESECFSKALVKLQNHLMAEFDVDKFFVQLFKHEVIEQELLINNGYECEASLTDHIWLNGAYRDLHIYGSPLNV